MDFALCTAYFAVLLVLAMYGLHRSHLVLTVLFHKRTLRDLKDAVPELPAAGIEERLDLPHVTIQLPLYTAATAVGHLHAPVAQASWTRARLHIPDLDE